MTEKNTAEGSGLVKVRTTFRPDQELEVTPQEELDLRRQGLLAEDQKPATPARKDEKA